MLGPSYSFIGNPSSTSCPLDLPRLHTTKWKLVSTFLKVFFLHILAFEVFLLPTVCVSQERFVMLPSGSEQFPSKDRYQAQGQKPGYLGSAIKNQ